MRRLFGIVLMLLIALSWAPAAICAVRCDMAASPAEMAGMNMNGMRMPGMGMSSAAIVGAHSCCPGPSAMVKDASPWPAWAAGPGTATAFTPPVQAGSVLVCVPRSSAVSGTFLLPTLAVSPPLPLRI